MIIINIEMRKVIVKDVKTQKKSEVCFIKMFREKLIRKKKN
jgi:hypothetical protein